MIESLRTTQIAFFRFATLCGFFRGSADEVQKVSVQGFVQEKLIWNHLWEHRFSVPDPRVLPPPGDHFLTPTTESPFKWLARSGSPVINNHLKEDNRSYIRNLCSCEKKTWKKFRLVWDSNPWPLRYRCSALLVKLTSQLGAGRWIVSL